METYDGRLWPAPRFLIHVPILPSDSCLTNYSLCITRVARELGLVTLAQLAFDGTRKVEDLAALRKQLAEKFAQLQAPAEAQDAADDDEERLVGDANALAPWQSPALSAPFPRQSMRLSEPSQL